MRVSVDGNLAYGKPVTLLTKHSEKYPAGGAQALTDGIHAAGDYHCNWLGFEAEHVDAVIDLGKDTTFSSVTTNFYQEIYSWTWLPLNVSLSVSSNGKDYTPAGSIACTVPETQGGVFKKEFRFDGPARSARYIRLTAQSRLTCPGWHIGAGKPCWLFIDEIVVR
jgi:hexosaminidase